MLCEPLKEKFPASKGFIVTVLYPRAWSQKRKPVAIQEGEHPDAWWSRVAAACAKTVYTLNERRKKAMMRGARGFLLQLPFSLLLFPFVWESIPYSDCYNFDPLH